MEWESLEEKESERYGLAESRCAKERGRLFVRRQIGDCFRASVYASATRADRSLSLSLSRLFSHYRWLALVHWAATKSAQRKSRMEKKEFRWTQTTMSADGNDL